MAYSFDKLQADMDAWEGKPIRPSHDCILGAAEEVGELCHGYLKEEWGVKGSQEEHIAEQKDAIADIIIYLASYCCDRGWRLGQIVKEVMAEVSTRDYRDMAIQQSLKDSLNKEGLGQCVELRFPRSWLVRFWRRLRKRVLR